MVIKLYTRRSLGSRLEQPEKPRVVQDSPRALQAKPCVRRPLPSPVLKLDFRCTTSFCRPARSPLQTLRSPRFTQYVNLPLLCGEGFVFYKYLQIFSSNLADEREAYVVK